MGVVLDAFYKDQRLLPDSEVCELLNWSSETLKAKRARREAPPSLKIKAIHLTKFDDLTSWLTENGKLIQSAAQAGKEQAAHDILT